MSDLLARLIADGTSPELVGEVAMLLAEKKLAQAAIEDRRTKDRERQNRRRSRDVTECHVTERDTQDAPSLSRPPNENNSNPPTHTHPDNYTPRTRNDPFPCPEWCEPEVWRDFKANRKAKRLPNTATAYAKLLRDIAALVEPEWPPGRLMEAIVARGWAAAYDPREPRNVRSVRNSPTAKPALIDIGRAVAADLERQAQASAGY